MALSLINLFKSHLKVELLPRNPEPPVLGGSNQQNLRVKITKEANLPEAMRILAIMVNSFESKIRFYTTPENESVWDDEVCIRKIYTNVEGEEFTRCYIEVFFEFAL